MSPALKVRLPSGRTVGYAEFGDPTGFPILALHGAPACREMFAWADLAAREQGLRLIAPDRPGYGLTPAETVVMSLKSMTAWLDEFAASLSLGRFGVLGISGGAPYAVALAARMGSRATALAIASPLGPVAEYAELHGRAALHPGHRYFFLGLPSAPRLLGLLGHLSARAFRRAPQTIGGLLMRLAGPSDAATLARPEVRAFLIQMTLEAFRAGGQGGVQDMVIFSQPWGVNYRQIVCPAILWQGDGDRIVPAEVSTHLAQLIPHCRLERLTGAGHFWVLDHTDEVIAALRSLIDTRQDV